MEQKIKGNRNTKYFYAISTERTKRNRIDEIKPDEGVICTEEGEIGGVIVKYFDNLFTIAQPQECDETFEGIPRTIIGSMNKNLIRSIKDLTILSLL